MYQRPVSSSEAVWYSLTGQSLELGHKWMDLTLWIHTVFCVSVSVLGCICQLIGPIVSCHLHSTGCFCPEVLSPVSQRLLWPVRHFLLHPAVRSSEASWLKREIEKEIFFINVLDLNGIKSPAVFEWLGVASGWAFLQQVKLVSCYCVLLQAWRESIREMRSYR